jgi:flavin reductase (DIM6/NTAB) family NADH-FMN oxidoreductase RutF
MTVTPDEFRAALGRFATGVTILTARDAAGKDHGMTVSSFASVSLTPPLVLACIARDADMYAVLNGTTSFVLSVLAADQEALSRRFADEADDRFDGIPVTRNASGVIVIGGAHAYVECRRVAWHDAGDHGICVGQVERASLGGGEPLLYYRSAYTRLAR